MADAEALKALKIKTGSCKRINKELTYYEKDNDKEKAKLEKMKEDNAEMHDIKQQENVLAEAGMMLPETRQRLESALTDLQAALAEVEEAQKGAAEGAEEPEEIAAARGVIAEAEKVFET